MLVEARVRDSMSLRHAITWARVTVVSVAGAVGRRRVGLRALVQNCRCYESRSVLFRDGKFSGRE